MRRVIEIGGLLRVSGSRALGLDGSRRRLVGFDRVELLLRDRTVEIEASPELPGRRRDLRRSALVTSVRLRLPVAGGLASTVLEEGVVTLCFHWPNPLTPQSGGLLLTWVLHRAPQTGWRIDLRTEASSVRAVGAAGCWDPPVPLRELLLAADLAGPVPNFLPLEHVLARLPADPACSRRYAPIVAADGSLEGDPWSRLAAVPGLGELLACARPRCGDGFGLGFASRLGRTLPVAVVRTGLDEGVKCSAPAALAAGPLRVGWSGLGLRCGRDAAALRPGWLLERFGPADERSAPVRLVEA